MNVPLTWISRKVRPTDDVQLADDSERGVWWAEVDVTLHVYAAPRMRRGARYDLAGLPAGVTGHITRVGLTRATLRLTGVDPEDVFDAMVRIDLEAAQRLHAHARAGGMR